MNAAEKRTAEVIESTLGESRACRKIENGLYVVKQGTTFVMINIVPWGEQAIVRCVAQLVKGVNMSPPLAVQLLQLNSALRFGAFAYVKEDSLVLLLHSILGGDTLHAEDLLATIRDVAMIADDWDDKIIARFGGQRMQDLLEERLLARILSKSAEGFAWDA